MDILEYPAIQERITPALAGGMTLLEAYSALTKNATVRGAALELPAPGMLPVGASEADFWHLQLNRVS